MPLLNVLQAVDSLRLPLARATGRPLLEEAEVQLLRYQAGGCYRRHVDDATGINIGRMGRQVRRSVSFLLYLTPDDWDMAADGGALRIFVNDKVLDVAPMAGTLVVLFDSAIAPHEVLKTYRARNLIAGWLQEQR